MDAEKVELLRSFVRYFKFRPSVLHHPSLWFFRHYLNSLGAKIPPLKSHVRCEPCDVPYHKYRYTNKPKQTTEDDVHAEIVESDIELKGKVAEPDNKMGDVSVAITEESLDATQHTEDDFADDIAESDIGLEDKLVGPDNEVGDFSVESTEESLDAAQNTEDDFDDDIVELDIGLEDKLVEPDDEMRDCSVESTEESLDTAQMYKEKALDAISEGKFEEAIDYLTEAITLDHVSAILYETRASVFVKMSRPNDAIRDADAALLINKDSAKGYKSRGMAKALLENWEEAASDLHMASKLDHDEEIQSVLKMVESNLQKIKKRHREYELSEKEIERRKAERHGRPAEASDRKSEYLSVLQDGNVLNINSSSELETKLKAVFKRSRLAILYFTATWCGPCRSMSPAYKNLAEQHPKTVFLKIDIDEVHDVAHYWNVSSIPTFFFVKDGKVIDKVVGADKVGLERNIALHST